MDVHISADREARLQQVAKRTGRATSELVEEAVDRMLEYESRFIEEVEKGRAAARRGEMLEHQDVVDRIERILRN